METVVINWEYFTGYLSVRSSQPSHMKDGTVEAKSARFFFFFFFFNFGSRAWRRLSAGLLLSIMETSELILSIIMRGKVSVRCQLKGNMIT